MSLELVVGVHTKEIVAEDRQLAFGRGDGHIGGDKYMSKADSYRQGIICYDLERAELTHLREKWGHPAWHPDSQRYIQMGNILFDTDNGPYTRIPNIPSLRAQHLAVKRADTLFVSYGMTETIGGPQGEWAVLVADLHGNKFEILHKFVGNQGARSWRVSHPHPVFSADGKRIY